MFLWYRSADKCYVYFSDVASSWIATLDRAAFGKSPASTSYIGINSNPIIGLPRHEPYNASLGLPALWAFPSHLKGLGYILDVGGFILTKIQATRNEALGGSIPMKWLQFGGWQRRDDTIGIEMATGIKQAGALWRYARHLNQDNLIASADNEDLPPEDFWRTLVADRGPNGGDAPTFYRRICKYVFKQSGVHSSVNTEQLLARFSLPSAQEFIKRVQEVVWNRQLIKTQRDNLGLAPEAAEKGDLVCILYGCSVPVVLRETDGGNYEFIGECYIHGMMDGQALKVQASEGISRQMFRLR